MMKVWFLIIKLLYALHPCGAFKVGLRKILCTTPIGGKETDALMDPRPNFPAILGYVGVQAALPSLGKCPIDKQIQPPWFTGPGGAGICPPEFYNFGAIVPGIVILGGALALYFNIISNRLLITTNGIGTIDSKKDIGEESQPEEILFKDVEEWNMTPVGLIVKHSTEISIFPLFWDQKSVEVLLEERIG